MGPFHVPSRPCQRVGLGELPHPRAVESSEDLRQGVHHLTHRAACLHGLQQRRHQVCLRRRHFLHLRQAARHRLSIAPSQLEPSRRYDLDLVAAVLQSPVVQSYWRVQLGGGLNVFPDLIESLPLPRKCKRTSSCGSSTTGVTFTDKLACPLKSPRFCMCWLTRCAHR